MNKTVKIIIQIVIVVAVVSGGAYFYLKTKNNVVPPPDNQAALNGSGENASDTIPVLSVSEILVPSGPDVNLLIISLAADDFLYTESEAKSGQTALALLEQAAQELEVEVKTKNYGEMGTLVEQIDSLANGQDNKYWIYYVNGEMAQVGADKYVLKGGDKVEWRFEASKF